MENRPGSSSVSAAEVAESHRKGAVGDLLMLVVYVVLGVAVGSRIGGTIVLVSVAILYQGRRALACSRIARTAKLVAADLASNPGATGWWLLVGLADGAPLQMRPAIFLVGDGTDYRIYLNGKVVERGTVTLVEDGEVRLTEGHVAEGFRAGRSYRRIWTVRDEILLSCEGAPGGPSPEGFSWPPDSDQFLGVWTKVS